ncbi:5770_t:CDS:1, partial [Ambispora gerdemannii]
RSRDQIGLFTNLKLIKHKDEQQQKQISQLQAENATLKTRLKETQDQLKTILDFGKTVLHIIIALILTSLARYIRHM